MVIYPYSNTIEEDYLKILVRKQYRLLYVKLFQ
jgi:hypothetical protein